MKLANLWRPALALVALAPLAFAQPAQAPVPAPKAEPAALRPAVPVTADPKISFERYTLPNGIEVILAPDPTVPLVAVNLWYHVGKDKHFDVLKTIGAATVNGSTNPDRTNYFEVVPSHQLETALWLESDRMGYLLDLLDQPSLANQIEVVRNERRQRYDNTPYGKARFAIYAALYPEGHPYRYLTIGKHEDLESAKLEDVRNFFKTWYVPANATLTLVGDFEPAAAKQLVERWFASFPKSVKPQVVTVPVSAARATEVTVDDAFAKLRQVSFVWHSPAYYAEGDAELDVAANALTREGPGRLYKALVYDRPLAQSVSAFQGSAQFSGIFQITVTLRGEAKLDEVKRLVAAEVARLAKEPLTDKEIQRVIAANESAAIRQLEGVLGRAETLQGYNHYLGDPDKISWDLDRYRTTTAEKIRATVARYLQPDRMITVITNPKSSGGK